MLEDMRSLSERGEMQQEHGTTQLPLQDLCYCTYTPPDGQPIIVDVIGTDEHEQIALLSHLDKATGTRGIWIAHRDQSASLGTWLWTEQQLEEARHNPVRISDEENDFRGDQDLNQPLKVTVNRDRRIGILLAGLRLGKTDAEVQAQLREEGFDPTLPANYRTEQGEMDLLKQWLAPADATRPQPAQPPAIKFSSRKKKRR